MLRRAFLFSLPIAALAGAGNSRAKRPRTFEGWATAHAQKGTTADGGKSRVGVVAADPSVLPLGSRIRVTGAGQYSGVYVVKDTGAAVKGREIDIHIPNAIEAKQFGRRRVTITILELGDRTQ